MSTRHLRRRAAIAALSLVAACGGSSSSDGGGGGSTQVVVWPAGAADTPGGAAMAAPFTIARNVGFATTRALHSLRADSLPLQLGDRITGLAWRRDAVEAQGYPELRGEVRIRVGSVPDATRLSGSFRNAWSSAPVEVVRRRTLVLPPASAPSGGRPAPFVSTIDFDQPFEYAGGDLGIEIEFTGPPGAIWRRDALPPAGATSAAWRDFAPGCPSTNGFVPRLSVDLRSAVVGGTIDACIDLAPWPGTGTAIAMLDIGDRIAPVPLEPLGFPAGCMQHVGSANRTTVALADRSSRFASARFAIAVPPVGAIAGSRLALQGYVTDSGSTATMPMAVSDGFELEIGTPAPPGPPLGRTLWRYGAPPGVAAVGGQVSPEGYVPVLQLTIER